VSERHAASLTQRGPRRGVPLMGYYKCPDCLAYFESQMHRDAHYASVHGDDAGGETPP